MRRRPPHAIARRGRRVAARLTSAALLAAAGVLAGCAPKPTALERYCDVVHQAEATFDPLSKAGSLGDPELLRRTLTDRVTTLNALAASAPDVVRADAEAVRNAVTAVLNDLAARNYVAASADADPVITKQLGDSHFTDATQRLADFNRTRCTA